MQVEIWSDIACPWCYVGTRAVRAGGRGDRHRRRRRLPRPSSSTRTCPPGEAPPLVEYLAREVRRPQPRAGRPRPAHQAGAELGIDFRWSVMRRANTFDAHRLLAWALRTEGAAAQRALKKALLRAYFTEGARRAPTRRCWPTSPPRSGLDRAAAAEVLATDAEAATVREPRRPPPTGTASPPCPRSSSRAGGCSRAPSRPSKWVARPHPPPSASSPPRPRPTD